jgi:hypothetical protein
MDKVQQFRRRAAECREEATRSTTADVRQNYIGLAEMWDRLAEERLAFFVAKPADEEDGSSAG